MEDKAIIELVNVFDNSSLQELNIEKDAVKISLKKAGALAPVANEAVPAQTTPSAAPVAAEQKPKKEVSETTSHANEVITSPIVGTFYAQPAPDAPAFVEAGKKVKAGDKICILEAMKIMNELEAEFDCEITKILVKNGDMVEFGTPLFEVKK